jgi:uncharacterized protein YqgV (UPF0045/DUF77 family)
LREGEPWNQASSSARNVSVYPVRQEHLSPAVQAVKTELATHGLKPEIGTMSTQVVGEAEAVFAALRDAFVRVAAKCEPKEGRCSSVTLD